MVLTPTPWIVSELTETVATLLLELVKVIVAREGVDAERPNEKEEPLKTCWGMGTKVMG